MDRSTPTLELIDDMAWTISTAIREKHTVKGNEAAVASALGRTLAGFIQATSDEIEDETDRQDFISDVVNAVTGMLNTARFPTGDHARVEAQNASQEAMLAITFPTYETGAPSAELEALLRMLNGR